MEVIEEILLKDLEMENAITSAKVKTSTKRCNGYPTFQLTLEQLERKEKLLYEELKLKETLLESLQTG